MRVTFKTVRITDRGVEGEPDRIFEFQVNRLLRSNRGSAALGGRLSSSAAEGTVEVHFAPSEWAMLKDYIRREIEQEARPVGLIMP